MSTQQWVVCEQTGRWAAALRATFARLPNVQSTPRLIEVRTLGDLSSHLEEQRHHLTLIEVRRENLSEVLQLLVRRGPELTHFVALLEVAEPPFPPVAIVGEPAAQPVEDLLWEMGAADVVESPRQLRGLLELHSRLEGEPGRIMGSLVDGKSFADWAWSTLPWQDP